MLKTMLSGRKIKSGLVFLPFIIAGLAFLFAPHEAKAADCSLYTCEIKHYLPFLQCSGFSYFTEYQFCKPRDETNMSCYNNQLHYETKQCWVSCEGCPTPPGPCNCTNPDASPGSYRLFGDNTCRLCVRSETDQTYCQWNLFEGNDFIPLSRCGATAPTSTPTPVPVGCQCGYGGNNYSIGTFLWTRASQLGTNACVKCIQTGAFCNWDVNSYSSYTYSQCTGSAVPTSTPTPRPGSPTNTPAPRATNTPVPGATSTPTLCSYTDPDSCVNSCVGGSCVACGNNTYRCVISTPTPIPCPYTDPDSCTNSCTGGACVACGNNTYRCVIPTPTSTIRPGGPTNTPPPATGCVNPHQWDSNPTNCWVNSCVYCSSDGTMGGANKQCATVCPEGTLRIGGGGGPSVPASNFDVANSTTLAGWVCWGTGFPDNNQSFSITFKDGSTTLGTVLANQERSDLSSACMQSQGGGYKYGFSYNLTPSLNPGTHVIHAYYDVANNWEINGSPKTVIVAACPWDIDGNGTVGQADLDYLKDCYSPLGFVANANGHECTKAKLSNDAVVNALDYSILLSHWGNCPGGPMPTR